MTEQTLDQVKAAAFGDKMVEMMNHAAISLMTSLGHQTGLFDAMADLSAANSKQIASAAQLNERYVQEWLAAMVTGRIIEYDPASRRYTLPPEHATWLTRAAGSDNLAREMQFVAMLGEVEQGLVESFKNGGGVPYAAYARFQKLMAENSRENTHARLLDTTLPLIPGMIDLLEGGIDVADIGCGQGHSINLMAKAFPNSRFTGYDFSEEAIKVGRANAHKENLGNAFFKAKDVTKLNGFDRFDLITAFDAIHDQAQPAMVLRKAANALKPGGTFLMVEPAASSNLEENMDHILGPWLYTISCMHCMTVSLALNGEGLGTMWGKQKALQMLDEAGFRKVNVRQIESDTFNDYYIARKGDD